MSKPPSIHIIVVPAEGPASDTGASVGALVGGAEVAVGSEVGGKAVGAEVGVGVGVEAGAQAASRIAINKIQIKRFIRFSCSYRELYLLHRRLEWHCHVSSKRACNDAASMRWAFKAGGQTCTKCGTK